MQVYTIRQSHSHQVSHELFSLASGCYQQVMCYVACVVKGVCFLTYDRDIRRKTQNSGVSVLGNGGEIYYKKLKEILKLQYRLELSVWMFQYKWFRYDGRRMVTDNNITSIDISTMAFKDD
ncbi:DUF4216 domain-containing protein [Abeliophyllum distichum]|uniref:DUF4216 domain-containing protein n=1 Tax=Abeliophyllum distichum TaxID=126358 RepID=A0ABD1QVR4_9LAMI